ncbi:hypothetical protein EVAR_57531_1 [Eumeta japonica]|uniref:Uncharacterized protein n=1 Tax=Eumeta variegata TaxID=151549 RepID=A0A4C1Y422_EUMVA|nr:hypothetical protein EVAR_57531_1 [Eumeta japonica]
MFVFHEKLNTVPTIRNHSARASVSPQKSRESLPAFSRKSSTLCPPSPPRSDPLRADLITPELRAAPPETSDPRPSLKTDSVCRPFELSRSSDTNEVADPAPTYL